jgi:uncharacterized protein (TIGR02217 family)
MAFCECEFPRTVAFKAMGGPMFFTTVNKGFSGFEQRNQNWSVARGEWSINLNTPSPTFVATPQEYIDQLTAFFLVVGGQANGFRFKDHKDWTNGTNPQFVAVGDGYTTSFQLIKTYVAGNLSYTKNIYKPITSEVVNYLGTYLTDTVDVYLNGSKQSHALGYAATSGAAYSLDYTTGIITFVTAPGNGVVITSTYQYHFPVRFDTDKLDIQLEESNVEGGAPIISWNSIGLQEIRMTSGSQG